MVLFEEYDEICGHGHQLLVTRRLRSRHSPAESDMIGERVDEGCIYRVERETNPRFKYNNQIVIASSTKAPSTMLWHVEEKHDEAR